jgi:hypothetical protein
MRIRFRSTTHAHQLITAFDDKRISILRLHRKPALTTTHRPFSFGTVDDRKDRLK